MYKPYQAYCDNCGQDVDYYIQDTTRTTELLGETYHYHSRDAFCTQCHGIAEHPAFIGLDGRALHQAYRENHGLISVAEVREISSLYNIEPQPLSKLLKWDKVPYWRYYQGSIPTPEMSAELRKLRNEPQYFEQILEANKEELNIITYAKSKCAVQRLLAQKFNSKLYYACLYFIKKRGFINKFALQKLLYYTQGFSRILLGYPLFNEACTARQYGPVFDVAYNNFKNQVTELDTYDAPALEEYMPDSFSDIFLHQEILLLDAVATHLGKFPADYLIEFTHSEKAWIDAYKTKSKFISNDAIYDSFIKLQIKHGIFEISDIANYSEYLLNRVEEKPYPPTGLVANPEQTN